MKIEFIHGPLDGQIRIVPDGITTLEVVCPPETWEINETKRWPGLTYYIYKYNPDIMTVRAPYAFTLVGTRGSKSRPARPRIQ